MHNLVTQASAEFRQSGVYPRRSSISSTFLKEPIVALTVNVSVMMVKLTVLVNSFVRSPKKPVRTPASRGFSLGTS
jgi:hypothetical protein